MENIAIDIYYEDISYPRKYVGTLIYSNGKYNLNSIVVNVQSFLSPKFYAVYRLQNEYVNINGYISSIQANQQKLPNNVDRVVNIAFSTSRNMLMFPITKAQSNYIDLHLAMHAHYVLTHYLSQPPIDKYHTAWGYPIPVTLKKTTQNEDWCFYATFKKPLQRDINISTKWSCSYYDSMFKHEYGHHIYNTIFGIVQIHYTSEYDVFESCDEQTAVNEGFACFLMTREPFGPLLKDDSDYKFDLNPDQEKVQSNFLRRSGESTIYSVAAALYELTRNDNNGVGKALDIFEKEKPIHFQQIWKKITNNERGSITNYNIDNSQLKYKQYLELLGIVYNRGIIATVNNISKSEQRTTEFKWGNNSFKKQLSLIDNQFIKDRSRVKIPTFPLNVSFHLQFASNENLMPANVGKGYYGLKIQGGEKNITEGLPVSSKMETAGSFKFQLVKIKDYDFAEKQLKKIICGGTILYVGSNAKALEKFYTDYWQSADWKTINVNSNGETDPVKLSYDEVYAVRVISYDANGIADSLYPKYVNPSQQMANLFITNTLFFFQTPGKHVKDLNLPPTNKPSNLPKGSNMNRVKGSSSVNPNYAKDGSEAVLAEVTVTLPGVTDVKGAKSIIDTEFIFRDFYEGKYENLVPELEKTEEEGQFIVRSEFNPHGNGEHKITAQFGELKEDEIEDAKASNTYAELIYTNDLVTPSVDDKFKKTTENSATIYGSIAENESGVGILSITNVDDDGKYVGAKIDYDIQLAGSPEITYNAQFLSKYLEIPEPYRKPCYNFIPSTFYDPLTGNFQLGTFEAYAPMIAKIKYKVTDKAGNESIQSISLNFMDIGFDDNKTDIHDKYSLCGGSINCSAWEIMPEVLSKNSNDYSISPATCSKQDIVLLNNKPLIESINFEKVSTTSNDTIDILGGNKLSFKYSDPDGSGDLGIDTINCNVTCGLTGELPREFSEAGGNYTHEFTINDDLLQGLEGEFEVTVKITDKIGAEGIESKTFHLNMGAPEIESDEELVETSVSTGDENTSKLLQGLISDRGTNTEDLIIIVKSYAVDNAGLRKSKTEKVFEINPANLKCKTDDQVSTGGSFITIGPGYPSLTKKSGVNKSLFNYDSSSGSFSYDIGNYDANKIESEITVYDKNCNRTVKTIRTDLDKNTATIIGSESSENSVKSSKNPPGIIVKQYNNNQFKASGIISDSDTEQKLIAVNVSTLKDSLATRTAAVVNSAGCNCTGFKGTADAASTVTYSNLSGSGSTVTGNSSSSSSNCPISSGLLELSGKAMKSHSGAEGATANSGGGGVFTLGPAWGGCTSLALQRGKEVPGETPTQISIPSGLTAGDEIKFDYDKQTGAFSLQAHPNSFSRTLKVTLDAYDESCNHGSQSVDFYFSGIGFQGLESPFWENETSTEIPTEYPVVNGNLPYGQVILNYINRVYDPGSGKNEFNLYEPDYTRTELYINGSQVNSFVLYDQLNIQAKANINADKLYYYSLFSGLWTLESPSFSFIFDAIAQIFDAFFPESEANSWQKIIPQEYYPRITKYQKIEYYYDNRLVLWGAYVPDHLTFIPIRPLPEGWNNARSVIYDYEGNKSETFFKFNVVYKPLIFDFKFNEFTSGSTEKSSITALIRDYGNNLDISGIRLMLDGIEIPIGQLNFKWDEDQYRGSIIYYLPLDMPDGEHKAILEVSDLNGNKDRKEIVFSTSFIKLVLDKVEYRDIEGNGDGIINEGERIFIDLNLKNTGKVTAEEVKAELLNKSRYIKGVPEFKAYYGQLPFNFSVINNKPYEFVVENQIFAQVDVEIVYAEFILQVTYQITSGEKKITKTIELPFTVPIEKLDPALADFRIWLNSSIKETLDPNYTLKGGWYINGTFIKEIKAENYSGSSVIPVEIVRDDSNQAFIGNAVLTPGENRFVVTATADNGAVRTAEVSVKLLSQVGIKLDSIADTKDPNVTVTGNAWTVNSKLEKVEIYLNGGLIGDAVLDGGRFSLPVTLNGGENIIRAVARDDQGKSAMDEIKVNIHGPLTLRWQRAHWRTTETPVAACGSYEVEGDDIASIVTYVNNTPNTYEVTIDRNLKTFCTTAGLQPGNNLLRAVGTTTGGVSAEAFSRVEYNTGGVLSITIDPPVNPAFETTATITGSFTLVNADPYSIQISVVDCEVNSVSYTPTINPLIHTFTATINLHDTIPNDFSPGDNRCDPPMPCDHIVTATITQGANSANNAAWITRTEEMEVYGVDQTSGFVCNIDTSGWIEGSFLLNVPSAHIASIRYHMYFWGGGDLWLDVPIYDEVSGIWHLDFDTTPNSPSGNFELEITDTFSNVGVCSGVIGWCQSNKGDPIPFDPNKAKNIRRVQPDERRKRAPKRAVDGAPE